MGRVQPHGNRGFAGWRGKDMPGGTWGVCAESCGVADSKVRGAAGDVGRLVGKGLGVVAEVNRTKGGGR